MSTTIQVQSFAENNVRERSSLDADALAGATQLVLESTQGLEVGQPIYVGTPGQEQCEHLVIQAVGSATQVTTTTGLQYDHPRFSPVLAVLGDLIHIYRAADVDGTVPADEMFTVLATRNINPDHVSTYYTDSNGSSSFWYRFTYYNATSGLETALSDSTPVRGDDFGHYASLSDIRREAGFENAVNLSDVTVDQARRLAEAEVNTRLGGVFTVPFAAPIPGTIEAVTIQLAAGFLLQSQYGSNDPGGSSKVKDARALLDSLATRDSTLPGLPVDGSGSGVSSWPNDSTAMTDVDGNGGERLFHIGDLY